jgi:hypothetical protein
MSALMTPFTGGLFFLRHLDFGWTKKPRLRTWKTQAGPVEAGKGVHASEPTELSA